MEKLVTVGIPVYTRLKYLPQALQSVLSQDYSNIELIVSDNGGNGVQLIDIVDKHYPKPYKLRQNPTSVPIVEHWNQVIEAASGEYFVLLSDDDAISPNYISELVHILENNPQVAIAFSRTKSMDEDGRSANTTEGSIPPLLSGDEFVKAWCAGTYHFIGFLTNMSRTKNIRLCGGFPYFCQGNHSENALVVKLCLNSSVAFNLKCVFHYRVYEASTGLSVPCKQLAEASSQFLSFLDSDPKILEFSHSHPDRWRRTKAYLIKIIWKTYFIRWSHMYRQRLTPIEWARAAFLLPFISAYYAAVLSFLGSSLLSFIKKRVVSS